MKHGQMNKNQIKKAFSLLEPSGQVREDIWNKIEKQIDEPTVGRMIESEKDKGKGYYRKFFLKVAAVFVSVVGILGAIDRMNDGKMMEVLANFWKMDKKQSTCSAEDDGLSCKSRYCLRTRTSGRYGRKNYFCRDIWRRYL